MEDRIEINGTVYIREDLHKSAIQSEGHILNYKYTGRNVFVRTATHYHIGRFSHVKDGFMMLSDAAWVADTGRFHEFLKTGKVNEAEPFVDDVLIPLTSIIDVTNWGHALIKEVVEG